MGKIFGYARVSTLEQNPDLQVDALTEAGAVWIFTDHASGATTARPELTRCLDHVDAGDTLMVWRIDRLSLAARGVEFRSLTEGIDTSTAGGELVFHIFAAVAQMERRLIQERTKAGLDAARARGRVGGRPRVITDTQLEEARRMIDAGRSVTETAANLGVGRTTLHRYLSAAPVGA